MPETINGVTHPVNGDFVDFTGPGAGTGDLGVLAATAGANVAVAAGAAGAAALAAANAYTDQEVAAARSDTSATRLRESVATSTALPTTGNEAGDARIAEDTGHFWVWDGTDWVNAGPAAQGPPGEGAELTDAAIADTIGAETAAAVAPMVDARTRPGTRPVGRGELVVNVLDHGAVADAPGPLETATGTDNRAAFQAAHDATPVGGTLFVPPGSYYLSGEWTITKAVKITTGTGGTDAYEDTGTRLVFPAGSNGIHVTRAGPTVHRPNSVSVGALKVSSKALGVPGAGVGILVDDAMQFRIPEGIQVEGFGSHGIFIKGSGATFGTLSNIATLFHPYVYGCGGDGIRCEGDDSQVQHILHPEVIANKGWGINMEGCAHNVIDHPHADQQYHASPGAFRDNGHSNVWRDVYSEMEAPFLIDADSLFCSITTAPYGRPPIDDQSLSKTASIFDAETGHRGGVRVKGTVTGTNYRIGVDKTNNSWFSVERLTSDGMWAATGFAIDGDGNFHVGGNVMYVPTLMKLGNLFLRDNGGTLEKSTDAVTWTAV